MINTLAPEAIIAQWVSAFNTRDLSEFRQLCCPAVTVHSVSPGNDEARGISRLTTLLQAYVAAFPDGQFDVETVDARDDFVTASWTAAGTNTGPFFYFPATNRRVVVKGTCRFRFSDGLVVEHWLDFNLYGILKQIGALFPEPGEPLPSSLAVCENAIHAWSDALTGRRISFENTFSNHVVIYATSFRMRTIEQGQAALAKTLAFIHANLAEIQLSIDRRISQGSTTTYRGNLTGVLPDRTGPDKFRFDCMFRTRENKVNEFWFRVWSKP